MDAIDHEQGKQPQSRSDVDLIIGHCVPFKCGGDQLGQPPPVGLQDRAEALADDVLGVTDCVHDGVVQQPVENLLDDAVE